MELQGSTSNYHVEDGKVHLIAWTQWEGEVWERYFKVWLF